MKSFWQASKQLLGGYPCVEHVVTKELSIIGRYGEIWQHDKLTFKAIIYSHRISKRYLPQEEWPIHAEDETLILFSAKELVTWVKRLGIPAKPKTQAGFANAFKPDTEVANLEILISEGKDQSKMVRDTKAIPLKSPINVDPGNENPDEAYTNDKKLGKPGGTA